MAEDFTTRNPTINNPTNSSSLPSPQKDLLGQRRFDRPRDVPDPQPMKLNMFFGGALSTASIFVEGA